MRRIVTIDKKSGKKKLVNVPSYDQIVVNNQMGQPAYDVSISSNGDGFVPTDLFLAGEKGVWYDISDLSTLFQDAAGTIPVTAVGQSVGKMLDKSGNNAHATQSTAANRPTYQVDPYGYPYLQFDGINDSMSTANINFTATDKMTATVGLLVDTPSPGAGTAIVLGGDPNTVNGSFLIGAPSSTLDHSFYLRGTSTIIARVNNVVSGDDVLTGIFDIGNPTKETELITRLSGVQTTNITWTGTTAGTGNFGNLPLYIGSLGGTGVFFYGHMYQIIVRGALSTENQVYQTETWVDSKME
jgi:hypothetical protein